MPDTVRATVARFCAYGLPSAAAAAVTAVLAPFGAWTAGFAALVGASAWAGIMRRRSTLIPVPGWFIGS